MKNISKHKPHQLLHTQIEKLIVGGRELYSNLTTIIKAFGLNPLNLTKRKRKNKLNNHKIKGFNSSMVGIQRTEVESD